MCDQHRPSLTDSDIRRLLGFVEEDRAEYFRPNDPPPTRRNSLEFALRQFFAAVGIVSLRPDSNELRVAASEAVSYPSPASFRALVDAARGQLHEDMVLRALVDLAVWSAPALVDGAS